MKKMKGLLVVALMCVMMFGVFRNTLETNAASTATYSPEDALAYARAHWNDGQGLCAEFVSRCVRAGGLNISVETGTGGCWRAICKESGMEKQNLKLNSSGYAMKADNENILAAGDVIVYWCTTCKTSSGAQGISPHVVLCGGYDSKGRATVYAHNSALNNVACKFNQNALHTSSTCNVIGQVIHITALPKPNGVSERKISYDNVYVKSLSDTTATVRAEVTADVSMYKEAGIYWGTTSDTTEKVGFDTSKNSKLTFIEVAFDGSEGPTLSRGMTYYYRFYAVRNDGTVDVDYTLRSFTTTGDNTPPQITSAYTQEVNGDGYTIICTVSDDVGVSRVCCPTWTQANGQDDLFDDWYNTAVATQIDENTYMYYVSTAEHDNEWGEYISHIYCYDFSGNKVNVEVTQSVYLVEHNLSPEFPLVDGGVYKIRSVGSGKVIDVPSGSSNNFEILHQWENCAAESQKWKAVQMEDGYAFVSVNSEKAMSIPDYSEYAETRLTQYDFDLEHSQIFKLIHRGDGKYSIHPICSDMALDVQGGSMDNGAEIMQYFYFGSDNQLWTFELLDTEKPVIKRAIAYNIDVNGYDLTCDVTDNIEVERVCFPTWTVANGQDDLTEDWYETTKATNVSGNRYAFHVDVADHNYEYGEYITHAYAFDTSGNCMTIEWSIDVPKPIKGIAFDKTVVNMEVGEKEILNLTISPADAHDQTIYWKSDNTAVATIEPTGEITAVGPGKATITATTGDGSNLSVSCVVTVVDKLSIDTQPTSASVNEGSNAVFKVDANNSNVTYQWQFKSAGSDYWADSTMTGSNTNSITVKATTARNGYQYRCVVKDSYGNKVTSNVATLTVISVQKVQITSQPVSATVSEGANATFKVAATGSNLTYQWQFKNATATYWTDSTMAGATTNSITVKGTTARNGYQYRCVVKDGSGNKVTSNAAKLTVNKAISITGQPASASVNEGANATFKVTATGSNLTYQWQFKNATATYWSDSTMAGATTNSITVKGTTARNGYQYRCVVKDANGNKVTSNAAKLTVVQGQSVKVTGQPASQVVLEGGNATFKVTASGTGLTYQWQFKNASSDYWSNSSMAGSNTNSITVNATTARNGYQYRCVVKDGNGNKVTSNAATLTVVQNPGVKITGQPASQTVTAGNYATFKVTASGSGLTYQWQFKSTANNYWADSTMAGSKTNSITVQGTTARNGYQYRCVVKDANGNKVTSNAAKLTVQ